ncbi:hypothetical protein [Enterococcus faecium]|uniref:hypothetical protein n=1 Tax=Enterococcus faecium TaxID=1352 RepID=UPI001D02CEA4|nr:hypothetical protein [Enterococcus faecium]
MANESLGNTLDKNIALFDKNMALEQENFFEKSTKVDVSAVVAENKKLKEENFFASAVNSTENAFQKSITRFNSFWLRKRYGNI